CDFAGTPSRRPGRIRTTAGYPARQGWVATPDLSVPFLNSLLGRDGARALAAASLRAADRHEQVDVVWGGPPPDHRGRQWALELQVYLVFNGRKTVEHVTRVEGEGHLRSGYVSLQLCTRRPHVRCRRRQIDDVGPDGQPDDVRALLGEGHERSQAPVE